MKSWQFTVLGLACLTVAGCRTDPNVALLERELRLQEDEIYRLRECIEDYRAVLEPPREDYLDLPRQLGAGDAEPSGGPALPGGPPTLSPPVIELPRQTVPEGEVPDALNVPDRWQDRSDPIMPGPLPSGESEPDDATQVGPTSGTGPIIQTDSSKVTQLTLNRQLTGGYDADGRPGDEGLVVVIEPHDAQGRWVEAPAEVSVAVLDPALEGEAARVARWDFTATETAALFRKTGLGRAIQLEMPWPARPPVHNDLHLFVRYTTSDGRRLEAEGPIQIALPGRLSRRWVSAAPARQASRPAGFAELSRAEPRHNRPTPPVRMATSPSPSPAAEPAEPKIERPVWSPDRR